MKKNPLNYCLIALSILSVFSSCKKDEDTEPETTPPTQVSGSTGEVREMQAEIDFIKTKATSVTKNSTGFWEADFGDGIVMIYVPAGSFTMGNKALSSTVVTGSYPATPEHKVNLTHYWISKNQISMAQFKNFVTANNFITDVEKPSSNGPWVYDFDEEGFKEKKGYSWKNAFTDIVTKIPSIKWDDSHPVSCVSWNDCIAYTNWLSTSKGVQFTLPTEAEWEFAARGTDGRIYPWGNAVSDGSRANYADDSFQKNFPNVSQAHAHMGVNDGFAITSPIGSFPNGASNIGALDMAGNLVEWVYDSEYNYSASEVTNPVNTAGNDVKMQKGGSWASSAGRSGQNPNELDEGHNIRSEARQGDAPNSADDHLGFRIAISYVKRS